MIFSLNLDLLKFILTLNLDFLKILILHQVGTVSALNQVCLLSGAWGRCTSKCRKTAVVMFDSRCACLQLTVHERLRRMSEVNHRLEDPLRNPSGYLKKAALQEGLVPPSVAAQAFCRHLQLMLGISPRAGLSESHVHTEASRNLLHQHVERHTICFLTLSLIVTV